MSQFKKSKHKINEYLYSQEIYMKKSLFVLIAVLSANLWADLPPLPSAKDKSLVGASSSDVQEAAIEEKSIRPNEGPHKGRIVAVANYNLEILWENDFARIYLLDSEFKNPTVQGSVVGVFIKAGNTESEMNCVVIEDYFECKQSGKKFKKGQLAISSKRNGVQAEEIKVEVPFVKQNDLKKEIKKKK